MICTPKVRHFWGVYFYEFTPCEHSGEAALAASVGEGFQPSHAAKPPLRRSGAFEHRKIPSGSPDGI